MTEYVHVVTHLEMGWDNVCGVYKTSEAAYRSCFRYNEDKLTLEEMIRQVEDAETSYIVHTKRLEA